MGKMGEWQEVHIDGSSSAVYNFAMRLAHVGIVTRDAEGLARILSEILGLVETARDRDEERGLAFIFLGEDPALELIQPLREGTTVARFLAERKGGLHHLAFWVEDLERALADLTARGYRVVDGPRKGALGHTIAFLHPRDTGYVLVELVQTSS